MVLVVVVAVLGVVEGFKVLGVGGGLSWWFECLGADSDGYAIMKMGSGEC